MPSMASSESNLDLCAGMITPQETIETLVLYHIESPPSRDFVLYHIESPPPPQFVLYHLESPGF